MVERKAVRKRIKLPNNGHVDIPCLEQVPFVVGAEQFQERLMYFKNGPDSYGLGGQRTVHIRNVPSLTDDSHIQVERIDNMMIKTLAEQAQERKYYFKNTDPPPILPDGTNDPAHEKVRYVRYYMDNDPNTEVWVDVELIERQKIIVAAEQYQEWMLYLRLDEIGEPVDDNRVNYGPLTVGTCDMSLPLATFEGSEIDPPYRLDPFQNIIQFSEEATATEAFMAVWIAPDAFGNQLSPASGNTGHWGGFTGLFKPNFPDHPLEFWYFNCLGGPLYDGAPHHSDLDMRFVDQFFDPKTYDNTGTGALGTSDVRGYTWSEWEQGFSPPPGYPTPGAPPAGLSGLWWYQLQAYIAANGAPPRTFPNMFDFTAYGFDGALAGPFTAWYNGVAAGHFPLEDGTNPTPVCAVRMAAIGSSTTDNPSGRY